MEVSDDPLVQAITKWSARVALVIMTLGAMTALSFIPVHCTKGGAGDLWPIPVHWGRAHMVACVELGILYVVLAIVLCILMAMWVWRLMKMAEWAK